MKRIEINTSDLKKYMDEKWHLYASCGTRRFFYRNSEKGGNFKVESKKEISVVEIYNSIEMAVERFNSI